MNERIKQLITKADTHAWSITEKYVARDCCHDGEDAFREKFAELIVRECYALVDYENKQFIKAQFKEHFGVEE
jgi:hypothetical protein